MLNLSLLIAILFSGAGLGLVLSKGVAWVGLLSLSSIREVSDPLPSSMIPAPHFSLDAQLLNVGPSVEALSLPEATKRVRCNCGLELPEESMAEHSQATGHSKPFSAVGLKAGKIWDLEEAVIETASPQCVKCGKPVPGLKRIGKTIYIQHLGCSGTATTKRGIRKSNSGGKTRRVRTRKPVIRGMCSICWGNIARDQRVLVVSQASSGTVRLHESCLRQSNWPPRPLRHEDSTLTSHGAAARVPSRSRRS